MRRGRRVGAAIALLVLTACAPPEERTPVTLVGVDGATWKVMDPLLAAGELPNFAALIETGVRGPLRSELPLVSPPIWTTIATGVRRARHGIDDFGAGGRFVSSRDRKVPALWTLAHDEGLRSSVVGWWGTYPAERIRGAIVSERALKTREEDIEAMFMGTLRPPSRQRLAYPEEALEALGRVFEGLPRPPTLGVPEREAVRRNMRLEDAASLRTLLALRELSGAPDLELVLLRGVDPVSHFFWRFYEPDAPVYTPDQRPSPAGVRRLGDVIPDHYRYVDTLIGELRASDPDRVFLIVSDHGFEAGNQNFRGGKILSGTHKSEAALQGIFIGSGGPLRAGVRAEELGIYDVAPLVLQLLGLPVARNLEGKLRLDLLDPAWLEAHPVDLVDRYEIEPHHLPPPEPGELDPVVDPRLREELRALGYIE